MDNVRAGRLLACDAHGVLRAGLVGRGVSCCSEQAALPVGCLVHDSVGSGVMYFFGDMDPPGV